MNYRALYSSGWEAWAGYCYARAHCNSFVYFSRCATARLILELDSTAANASPFRPFALCVSTTRVVVVFFLSFSFLLLPFFLTSFSFVFLFSPRTSLHRVESLWRIKNSGRWIGLNTNFKEWNDVERICNFAEGVDFENFARTLKRLDHREIFSNSSIFFFFFFNRKENSDFTILSSSSSFFK